MVVKFSRVPSKFCVSAACDGEEGGREAKVPLFRVAAASGSDLLRGGAQKKPQFWVGAGGAKKKTPILMWTGTQGGDGGGRAPWRVGAQKKTQNPF